MECDVFDSPREPLLQKIAETVSDFQQTMNEKKKTTKKKTTLTLALAVKPLGYGV